MFVSPLTVSLVLKIIQCTFYGKFIILWETLREKRSAHTSMVCVESPRSLKILLSPAKQRKSMELGSICI